MGSSGAPDRHETTDLNYSLKKSISSLPPRRKSQCKNLLNKEQSIAKRWHLDDIVSDPDASKPLLANPEAIHMSGFPSYMSQ